MIHWDLSRRWRMSREALEPLIYVMALPDTVSFHAMLGLDSHLGGIERHSLEDDVYQTRSKGHG